MSEWRAIETAPKDGSRALFFQPGNPNALCKTALKDRVCIDHAKGLYNGLFYREYPEARYTHWMPLPNPPEGEK